MKTNDLKLRYYYLIKISKKFGRRAIFFHGQFIGKERYVNGGQAIKFEITHKCNKDTEHVFLPCSYIGYISSPEVVKCLGPTRNNQTMRRGDSNETN